MSLAGSVKHAAREGTPLLAGIERGERAFGRITAGQSFSDEQRAWLGRIREHLVSNLSLNAEDFDTVPILSRAGDWGRANRVFHGKLPDLIRQINEAVAA